MEKQPQNPEFRINHLHSKELFRNNANSFLKVLVMRIWNSTARLYKRAFSPYNVIYN